MEQHKKRHSSIIFVFMFILGLLILLYPAIANYVNSKTQSVAIQAHNTLLEQMAAEEKRAMITAAEDYNRRLAKLENPFLLHGLVGGYDELLNAGGNGIMGYVTIDKIGVELPIYHGTSDSVLSKAAGHFQGTSLPVGGSSTHSVISAHRGLPHAKLFTDLDELEVGDVFKISVIDRVLVYEVEEILIVEPNDLSSLRIRPDSDYVTLQTCTPYAINTHRLLVHGRRIATADKPIIYVYAEAFEIDPIIVTPIVAIPMLIVLFIFLMVKYRPPKPGSYQGNPKEFLEQNPVPQSASTASQDASSVQSSSSVPDAVAESEPLGSLTDSASADYAPDSFPSDKP